METNTSDKKRHSNKWLSTITEQSWEPELLISGLAIYASLQLPDLFWKGYRYYQFNLQSGSGILDEVLPLLIYALFTTVAYILAVSFITHFVVRAFWVGFIGLLSVYPEGIKYDNLPFSTHYKNESRKSLGSSEKMALTLDNISSLIFSISFSLVLIMVAVGILYFVFFLLYNVLKLFINPEVFDTYASVMYITISVIGFLYLLTLFILNMKRLRSNPKAAKWHFNLSWKLNAIIMPLVYRPVQFISLTFLSHLSSRRFMTYYTLLGLIFIVILFSIVITTLDSSIGDARNYFSTRSPIHQMDASKYSHNLKEGEWLSQSVIEKPIVSSDYLEIFIPYPKLLDEKLNQFCEQKVLADSLENFEKRRFRNEHNIACAEQFFSLTVDDSLKLSSELMFSQHARTGQRGFQTYVEIRTLSPGRHILQINRLPVDKTDSTRMDQGRLLSFENAIPFWKEN